MRNSQATIRDIAIKLNISISTVSRALRNAADVNPETKKAVLEMAKCLHYEPNRIAQSLRIRKTKTLGVIVPEIALHFFSTAISGIQEYAAEHNYNIIICQSLESFTTEIANIHMLVSTRVDGVIISLSSQTKNVDLLQNLVDKKIPIVQFDRVSEELATSKVEVDDHDGAFGATDFLIKTGCRRIAFIGGPGSLHISSQREKGYVDALQKNGINVNPELIAHCKDLSKDPPQVIKSLLNLTPAPDAFFCLNDPIAIAAIGIIKERGMRIPDDISVVGFTNEPVSAFIEPALTTVSQPAREMGHAAARILLRQINSDKEFKPITQVLKTELLVRKSTRQL
jgi:LacI family transcriptional regulator